MKTFKLQSHSNPITKVLFNREGDLLFVSCKDQLATVWYTETGKVLGSFNANSSIFDIDVSCDSKVLIGGTSGGTLMIWNAQNGKEILHRQLTDLAQITSVKYDSKSENFLVVTPWSRQEDSSLSVYTLRKGERLLQVGKILESDPKMSMSVSCWGPNDETFVVATKTGVVIVYDFEKFKKAKNVSDSIIKSVKVHDEEIRQISLTPDQSFLLTASLDQTSKLIDVKNLEIRKIFKSGEPVNTAAMSPIKPHVVVGGGTRSQEVTTTFRKGDTFDTSFYHCVFEKEIGTMKGHFGPIHCLAFSPDGKSFASGGEDSMVRLYKFNKSYLEIKDDAASFMKNYVD